MRNFNAKTKRIVDLKKMEIIEVGELAAEAKTNTSRFSYPENVTLTIDATDKQRKDLKRAIDFNNGVYSDEIKEEIAGLQFIDEPVKEEKKPNVKNKETESTGGEKMVRLTGSFSKNELAELLQSLAFESFTLKELKQYASENNIDIKGLTTKKAILNKLEQK